MLKPSSRGKRWYNREKMIIWKSPPQPHAYFCKTLFVGLLEGFRPTREFLTYMETSPLPVKGYKFWPMLDTHCHWVVRFLSVPHLLWHGTSIYNYHLWGPVTLTAFGSGAVTTCFCNLGMPWLGFEHPTFHMQG